MKDFNRYAKTLLSNTLDDSPYFYNSYNDIEKIREVLDYVPAAPSHREFLYYPGYTEESKKLYTISTPLIPYVAGIVIARDVPDTGYIARHIFTRKNNDRIKGLKIRELLLRYIINDIGNNNTLSIFLTDHEKDWGLVCEWARMEHCSHPVYLSYKYTPAK